MEGLTYKGSISDAIAEAQKQKKIFLVHISGEDENSTHLKQSTWADQTVSDSISRYCIFLHLIQGSIEALQFSAIYPQKSVPSITAVRYNGVMLWQNEGYISAEDFVGAIEKAWASLHFQETAATLLTAALASTKPEHLSSSSQDVAQVNSSASAQVNSSASDGVSTSAEEHLSSGQIDDVADVTSYGEEETVSTCKTSEDVMLSESGDIPTSTSNASCVSTPPEDNLTVDGDHIEASSVSPQRTNISGPGIVQVAATKVEKIKTEIDGPTRSSNVIKSEDIHLNIRLPNGASLQRKFTRTDTLRSVKDYVDENQISGMVSYDLAVPYPRKVFNEQGYFLNPKYQYANDVVNDDEVLNGFHRVVNRMVNDNETRLNINREAERFRLKTGAFGSHQFQSAVTRCLPAEWWSIYAREDAPNLTRLAVRILSQTVSSSNCERNWTTFSLIHTRPRNRLTMARLEKLVFVHYNMRLRVRNIQRSRDNQNVIDLDEIFHDQDPLTAWTREKEAPVLDGRDNEWLDDNLDIDPQDTAANARRPEKRKKTPNVPSRQVDSDKDDSTDSGGDGATLPTGVYQSHDYENPGDQSHEYSGDWSSDHQPREHRMDDVYAGGSTYHDVPTPSDNYNTTYDSSFTSYYPYNTPEAEAAEQHSTFDGLMTSFFNDTDINLYYPHNQQPYRDDSDNYEPF